MLDVLARADEPLTRRQIPPREIPRLVEQPTPDVVHAFTIKPVVHLPLVVAWRSLRLGQEVSRR